MHAKTDHRTVEDIDPIESKEYTMKNECNNSNDGDNSNNLALKGDAASIARTWLREETAVKNEEERRRSLERAWEMQIAEIRRTTAARRASSSLKTCSQESARTTPSASVRKAAGTMKDAGSRPQVLNKNERVLLLVVCGLLAVSGILLFGAGYMVGDASSKRGDSPVPAPAAPLLSRVDSLLDVCHHVGDTMNDLSINSSSNIIVGAYYYPWYGRTFHGGQYLR